MASTQIFGGRSWALLALTALGLASGPSAQVKNVLVVLLDDVGKDSLGVYGIGSDPPATPTIDALAQAGVVFHNCWSNPLCAPTRATIQTGRYGLRTGIGDVFGGDLGNYGLQLEEITLPEMLAQGPNPYSAAYFGKWHLGGEDVGGLLAPNLAGYEEFSGTIGNLDDYYAWEKLRNGTTFTVSNYATSENVDDAIAWIAQAEEPWFVQIAFNACHGPFHAPPPDLHSVDLSTAGNPQENPRPYFKAMVEAIDTELGRLFSALGPTFDETGIFILSDNGTAGSVVPPPVDPNHAKGTLFEPSLNVPLIVRGPFVSTPGESFALVNTSDLYATIAEITDVDLSTVVPPGTQLDSVSFLPNILDPTAPSQRTLLYAEVFGPNGPTGGLPVPLPPDPANVCQRDLGHGSPGGPVLSVCGPVLASGNETPLNLSGAPADQPLWLFFSEVGLSRGLGAFLGNRPLALPVDVIYRNRTAPDGTFSLHGLSGPPDSTVLAQVAVRAPSRPGGFVLSNLLELDWLPRNLKAARDERYKLVWSVNGGPQRFYDLTTDPFETTDLLADGGTLSSEEEAHRSALEAWITSLLQNP